MGSQVALSSYNKFTNNTLRDAFIIGICNSLTSLYAGFVVFAILGFLAHHTGSSFDSVVNDGITLAFVSYPSALLEMTPAPFWSFMFFFMLINLAISSGCGGSKFKKSYHTPYPTHKFFLSGLQTIATCLMDEIPSLQKHRMKVFMGLSAVLFLLGTLVYSNFISRLATSDESYSFPIYRSPLHLQWWYFTVHLV